MKYIRNRNQFNNLILEQAPANQIYDGTWEDTFVGRFFSFLGKKVIHKMKKGGLKKLLNNMQRELEKSQFKTVESEPIIQRYQVYQNIAIVKSYIKTSDDFNIEDLTEYVDIAIEEHREQSDNIDLPDSIRKAHSKVLKGFEDILKYINSLESINESLTPEGEAKNLTHPGEIVSELFTKPFSGDVKLSSLKLTGNQKGYDKYKSGIKNTLLSLAKSLTEIRPYISDKEEKESILKLIDLIKGASFDDYASFGHDFDKNIKPLANNIIKNHINYLNKLHMEDTIKEDDSKIYVKWMSSKGDTNEGYGDKKVLSHIVNDDGTINLEKWEDVLKISNGSDDNKFKIFPTNSNSGTHLLDYDQIIKDGRFKQIGDVEIVEKSEEVSKEEDTEDNDDIRQKIDEKMDSIFSQDEVYKKEMTVSENEMKDIQNKMKTKTENQKDVVDPIAILRIFNRAYNSFSITKEEYNDLSNKYRPRVASQKKAQYEIIENSARDKKLFREWNDGVLSMLQQYGEYLNKTTKKFIITMLDDNHLFGNKGAQAKLLSEYFEIPLEDSKSKLKDIDRPAEHKVRMTEDNIIEFKSVKDIEMNTDKIRRIPFVLEVLINGRREKLTAYPLNANKSKSGISSLKVKYTIGEDFGFLRNYMEGIDKDFNTKTLTDIGMVDNNDTPIFVGNFLSDNGVLQKNNEYKLTEINRLSDNSGSDDIRMEINEIYMLLGRSDEGMYRLPTLNDKMKKTIRSSKYDNLI